MHQSFVVVFRNILRWWSVSALVFVSHSRVSLISPYSHVKKKPRSNKRCSGGCRIFFRRGCTRLLLYFNINKPYSFFFLQNTSCIRKPQVISGGGVRTPYTLPLDPPLRCYISCMTHAKILVILVFQSGRENQRATRAMRAMRRNRVLRNCKCMKNVSCLVPRFCWWNIVQNYAVLIDFHWLGLSAQSLLTRVKHLPYGLYGQALLRVKTFFRD